MDEPTEQTNTTASTSIEMGTNQQAYKQLKFMEAKLDCVMNLPSRDDPAIIETIAKISQDIANITTGSISAETVGDDCEDVCIQVNEPAYEQLKFMKAKFDCIMKLPFKNLYDPEIIKISAKMCQEAADIPMTFNIKYSDPLKYREQCLELMKAKFDCILKWPSKTLEDPAIAKVLIKLTQDVADI